MWIENSNPIPKHCRTRVRIPLLKFLHITEPFLTMHHLSAVPHGHGTRSLCAAKKQGQH
jgi:hypothetical protein